MIRELKPKYWPLMTMILALLLLGISPMSYVSAAESTPAKQVTVKLNGENLKISDTLFVQENRIYAPVARVAEKAGATFDWDSDNEELTLHTALNDEVVLGSGVPVVYFNDVRYLMEALPVFVEGRLYLPLRQIAELLHANMNASTDSDVIELTTVKQETVTEDRGLDAIIQSSGSTKAELLERNGLTAKSTLKAGTKLKVVIPSFFASKAKPFTEADLKLLAKITMVEAGYEGYEGQLALANVILNRVKSSNFPDTIRDVIYSGRQFPPAHNGLLDKSKPNAGSLRAAKDALNGKNNVQDAVYFFNPAVSKGSFWSGLDVIVTIGHHSFAK